jgi:hypothetical protein
VKIQYKQSGGSGQVGWQTLADSTAGDVIRDWKPKAALASVQHESLAAAVGQNNNSYRQPLGNISEKISVQLTVVKANETQAAAFAMTTRQNLLGSKNDYLVTFGSSKQLYANGVCSACSPSYEGATIEFQIELESDLVQDGTNS